MSGKTVEVSSDERREVAARLRKAVGLTEFAEVLGFNWDDGSDWVWNDVSNFVADLIEPEPDCTARLEYDEVHGCNVCTGCGERYEHGMYMAVTDDGLIAYKPMRYCPACGARLEEVER